ncbi:MAG: glutathione peroxidase [Nocardioidaceae bacterium]|nr:glutathione peroxidase [Nocardioidaceae bacterium]
MPTTTTAGEFSATTVDGKDLSLRDYAGEVLLIVNVASQCGFTPQYEGLEALWRRYRDRGLVVLGFPCDQFGNQEPGSDQEIASFCSTRFDVTFPMFAKVDVNGDDAHPLYAWLREEKSGLLGRSIRWNFTKFLVGRDGRVVKRYGSKTTPERLTDDIEKQLAA